MGEAKRRGAIEARIAQSKAAQQEMEPINIQCKTCSAILNGFEPIHQDASGTLWAKVCECGATTEALVPTQHASVNRSMSRYLPLIKERCGADRRMSLSFLEKSPKTVNTGMVVW